MIYATSSFACSHANLKLCRFVTRLVVERENRNPVSLVSFFLNSLSLSLTCEFLFVPLGRENDIRVTDNVNAR